MVTLAPILLAASLAVDPLFVGGAETTSKAALTTELRDDGFDDRLRLAWSPAPGTRLSASLPFRGRSDRVNRRTGLGDLSVEGRAVLHERATIRVALDAAFTLPTGDAKGHLAPGSGSTDFTGGGVVAHAGPRLLLQGGARGRLATQSGRDAFAIEAAAGAWLARSERTSALALVEVLAERVGPERRGGTDVLFSRAERTLFVAPALALRVDRIRLKGGVAIPVRTDAAVPPWRVGLALEVAR